MGMREMGTYTLQIAVGTFIFFLERREFQVSGRETLEQSTTRTKDSFHNWRRVRYAMEVGHINRRSVFLQKHHLGSSGSFLRHQQPFLLIYDFFLKGRMEKCQFVVACHPELSIMISNKFRKV